jgi:hypothetical protein
MEYDIHDAAFQSGLLLSFPQKRFDSDDDNGSNGILRTIINPPRIPS